MVICSKARDPLRRGGVQIHGREALSRIRLLTNRIRLRLNPQEEASEALLEIIRRLRSISQEANPEKGEQFDKAMEDAVSQSPKEILKAEWKRVRGWSLNEVSQARLRCAEKADCAFQLRLLCRSSPSPIFDYLFRSAIMAIKYDAAGLEHHLTYEIRMLNGAYSLILNICDLLVKGGASAPEQEVALNGMKELFCLHARLLIEFFTSKRVNSAWSFATVSYVPPPRTLIHAKIE